MQPKQEDNSNAPEKVVVVVVAAAAARAAAATKPSETAFGPTLTLGYKITGLENDDKDCEANDGSTGSSYKANESEARWIVQIMAMIHLLLIVN